MQAPRAKSRNGQLTPGLINVLLAFLLFWSANNEPIIPPRHACVLLAHAVPAIIVLAANILPAARGSEAIGNVSFARGSSGP